MGFRLDFPVLMRVGRRRRPVPAREMVSGGGSIQVLLDGTVEGERWTTPRRSVLVHENMDVPGCGGRFRVWIDGREVKVTHAARAQRSGSTTIETDAGTVRTFVARRGEPATLDGKTIVRRAS